jgi:hypothetical protein
MDPDVRFERERPMGTYYFPLIQENEYSYLRAMMGVTIPENFERWHYEHLKAI